MTAPRSRVRAAAGRARGRLSRVARIARWESTRTAGTVDRRTALLGLAALLVVAAAAGAAFVGGASFDREVYRVGVAADSSYHEPVTRSGVLAARPADPDAFAAGDLDVLVRGDEVRVRDSQKSQAALAAFRDAVEGHNDRLMAREGNVSAAFPVVVSLRYVDLSGSGGAPTIGGGSGDSAGGADGAGGDASGDAGSGTGESAGAGAADGPLPVPAVGGGAFTTDATGSPAGIQPPFPFGSLVLAFAFLVPLNFVIQAYGGTVLNERVNRRGELLLTAPVSPVDIVAGKTLPYLLVTVALTLGIAAVVGGGAVAVAAVVPVGLLFLASTFVGAMFARSFKELTFVTVAVSVFLTTYTFVPAIFTDVTPIALISPLTLVVRDLQSVAVTPLEYLFSTGPFYVASFVLFGLGAGVYREEDMFTQRPVPLKFLDALDSRLSGLRSVAAASALSIPFVFIAELLAIAVLYALPLGVTVPVLLLVIAAVEEVAKSAHVYAGYAKSRFGGGLRTALALGVASGFGFFVGEKFTAVVQVVGLDQVTLGRAAFAPAGVGLTTAAGLLLAPLVLHAVTASVTAAGASRSRAWYAATLAVATLLHAAYNFTVVSTLG